MPEVIRAKSPIDDDLNQIERDVRTLKIEYEQYFGGGRPRPPADTQWRVDSMIRRWNERGAEMSSGQRFRFNNLTQTYAKYQDMWRKKVMQREAATAQHHFGAAAKIIEAERARAAAREREAAPSDSAPAPGAAAHRAGRRAGEKEAAFALSLSDPEKEMEKVERLYRKLIEVRSETGESAGAPSLGDFQKFVRKKTEELKKKGGHEIEYSVAVVGGRVKLKARIQN
ncbi:MAG: MXAN_5187 C-terminal domain-containing protein [Candidatus Acidiferrales bacterium]